MSKIKYFFKAVVKVTLFLQQAKIENIIRFGPIIFLGNPICKFKILIIYVWSGISILKKKKESPEASLIRLPIAKVRRLVIPVGNGSP